jgi:hypothetical protein
LPTINVLEPTLHLQTTQQPQLGQSATKAGISVLQIPQLDFNQPLVSTLTGNIQ